MSDLIHNERVKLSANWINILSGGLMAAGVFAPAASLALGIAPSAAALPFVLGFSCGCLMVSAGLHYLARRLIGKLRE